MQAVSFTTAGAAAGFARTLPVALGVSVFGVIVGLVAGQKGLSVAETVLMSALVFAGASQMVALELWADPMPVLGIVAAVFVINLRYAIMSAALEPWLSRVRPAKTYASLAFVADENWAVSIAEMRAGGTDAGFLLGTGLALYSSWVASTVVGRLFGGLVVDPGRYGLDFVGVAVFVALIAPLWTGRRDLLPWIVAGGVAVAASWALPGTWYLVLGGLAGSFLGAWRNVR